VVTERRSPSAAHVLLEQERRRGRLVGVAAFAGIAAMLASVVLTATASTGTPAPVGPGYADRPIDHAQRLTDLHGHELEHTLAVGLRVAGLVLVALVGLHLWTLVRTRDARVATKPTLWLTIIGPGLVAASTVVGFVALSDVAQQFVAEGGGTTARARELIDDSTMLRAASSGDTISRLVLALWLGFIAVAAMKVGLLTRFLGYWGMAAAAAFVVLPIGDALLAGWMACLGALMLGWWPGGRPPAWSSTRAIPADAT